MNRNATAVCIAALSLVACKKFGRGEQEKTRAVSDNSKPQGQPVHAIGGELPHLQLDGGTRLQSPPGEDAIALRHAHADPIDHLARARELSGLMEPDGALIEARRALFDDPTDEDALAYVAKLGEKAGQKKVAIEALRRLARLRKNDATPLIRQARLLISTRELDEAERGARAAIVREPENPEGYQVAGRAYLAQGELAPAIRMFSQVIELSPNHGHALNNLGFAYLRSGQDDEAVEVLTRAAELLSDVAYVQNNLGVALERAGRMDEAGRAFARAIELSPRYLKAQLNAQRLRRLATMGEMGEQDEVEDPGAEPDEAPKE